MVEFLQCQLRLFVFMSRCLFHSPVTAGDQATTPTDEQRFAVFQKDLVMNVFRNGVFGSFRHIPLLTGVFMFFDYLLLLLQLQCCCLEAHRILQCR